MIRVCSKVSGTTTNAYLATMESNHLWFIVITKYLHLLYPLGCLRFFSVESLPSKIGTPGNNFVKKLPHGYQIFSIFTGSPDSGYQFTPAVPAVPNREFKKLRRQLQGKRHIKIELCVKLRLLRLFHVDHVVHNRRSAISLS